MESGKAVVCKGETSVVIVNGRIEENLRMQPQVGERGFVVELIVEDLHHNIGTGKVGEPIAKDVLRQKPPTNPTALKIVTQRFPNRRLRKGAGLVVSESIVHRRQCAA